jgi:ATP-dependent RNA helicase DDX55/SPB4
LSQAELISESISRNRNSQGVKAFVSYVQFYSKHEASYIFKLDQLDLLSLAFHGFGLIKLPKMPELKKLRNQLELVTPDGFEVGKEEFDVSMGYACFLTV